MRGSSRIHRAFFVAAVAIAAILVSAARPTPDEPESGQEPPVPTVAGKLLVAAPSMPDPRFRASVILMIEHDANGAFGLIINKPMGEIDSDALLDRLGAEHEGENRQITVFYGGPVEMKYGFVIHSTDFSDGDTRKVSGDIAVSAEPSVIAAIAQGIGPTQALFALGYAGWGAGQLEREMERDDWFTAPADKSIVFDPLHGAKWKRALESRFRSL